MEHETYESVQDKIRHHIEELDHDLTLVERQARLGMIAEADAASIRKSILQSISDLRQILHQ